MIAIGIDVLSKELDINIDGIETFVYEQNAPVFDTKIDDYTDGFQLHFTYPTNPRLFNIESIKDKKDICTKMWTQRANTAKLQDFYYTEPTNIKIAFETDAPLGGKEKQYSITFKHNKAFDLMKQTKQKEPIDESAKVFNEAFSDFADGLLNE